jgi:hypothetical protein
VLSPPRRKSRHANANRGCSRAFARSRPASGSSAVWPGEGVTTKKELLRNLHDHDIPCVLIGGLALRLYDSPRVTPDMDLAIRATDVDEVIDAMYAAGFALVTAVSSRWAEVQPEADPAREWVEGARRSSLTFVERPEGQTGDRLALEKVDITTQVDFLFDLCIPFPRLKQHALEVSLDDFDILLASAQDLLTLKENRDDKSAADEADIGFLREQIARDARGT